MKIVNYDPSYYDELWTYMHKHWPNRSKKYLDYRLFELSTAKEAAENLLVLNDNGKIVGTQFVIPAKALIKGEERNIRFGCDTRVDEEYHGDGISLDLMLKTRKIKEGFAIGLSDVNKKIQQKLRTRFIAKMSHYMIFTKHCYKIGLFYLGVKTSKSVSDFKLPSEVTVGTTRFKQIFSSNELKIPNNGYWSGEYFKLDFIRDDFFFRKHFFENFKGYSVYKLELGESIIDECYFVVRMIVDNGLARLLLIDYRYNVNKPIQLEMLLKAASRIASHIGISVVQVSTSQNLLLLYSKPFILKRGVAVDVIANSFFELNETVDTIVTRADSDLDFID